MGLRWLLIITEIDIFGKIRVLIKYEGDSIQGTKDLKLFDPTTTLILFNNPTKSFYKHNILYSYNFPHKFY